MAQQPTVSRKQYDDLAAFATAQAQRAERSTLMTEFGLTAEELGGEFASPREMRMQAELVSLRKQVAGPAPVAHEPPEDTGGPRATRPTTYQELDALYERAKKMGRTRAGRAALLQAIYSDPRKTSPLRPEGE